MVDLAHLSPEQKSLVIRGDANYQFVYVNYQPVHVSRINQEIADKIGEMYNGSAMHARILEMHTPLMQLIKETDIDSISIERIVPIMKDLITYDYTMFLDLMTILAAMLEAKDVQMKSNHIDFTVECTDMINDLASANSAAESMDSVTAPAEGSDDYVTVDDEVIEEEILSENNPVAEEEILCEHVGETVEAETPSTENN